MVTVFVMDLREPTLARQKVAQGNTIEEADRDFVLKFKSMPAAFKWAYYCIEMDVNTPPTRPLSEFNPNDIVMIDDNGYEVMPYKPKWSSKKGK